MASLHIETIFTNILLQETIDLFLEYFFKNRTHVDNLSEDLFRKLLTATMLESLILFHQNFYKHYDRVTTSFRLVPALGNVLIFEHQKI